MLIEAKTCYFVTQHVLMSIIAFMWLFLFTHHNQPPLLSFRLLNRFGFRLLVVVAIKSASRHALSEEIISFLKANFKATLLGTLCKYTKKPLTNARGLTL